MLVSSLNGVISKERVGLAWLRVQGHLIVDIIVYALDNINLATLMIDTRIG